MNNVELKDSIQLLNTAIIKFKEKKIDATFEDRLKNTCNKPAIKAISIAIDSLSESENISRDQSAIQIIECIKELESVWTDYVMAEGMSNVKNFLKIKRTH
jgi:hypothetical protein